MLLGIGVYFYLVWLPKSVEFAKRESFELLHHSLEIVEDQITQDLVAGNMDSVRQNLDLMLLKNPTWQRLELKNAKNVLLYPEEELDADTNTPLPDSGVMQPISLDMEAYGKKIGNLWRKNYA